MKFLKCILLVLALSITFAGGMPAGTLLAQEAGQVPPEPLARSAELFSRAATALEERSISPKTLDQLRSQLVEVRDASAEIIDRGNIRASALEAQLNSLGAPPADGQKEAEEVAARRLELTNALAAANAPVRVAGEINNQAIFYIRQVDRQLRARQFSTLLDRYPSPLAPSTWAAGFQEIGEFIKRFERGVQNELARPSVSKKLHETVPLSLGLAIFGILFLTVLQHPISRALKVYCEKPATGAKALMLAVLYNASFIVLPTIGAVALVSIFPILDIYPNSVRTAVIAVPVMALVMIIANWLGHTIFAPGRIAGVSWSWVTGKQNSGCVSARGWASSWPLKWRSRHSNSITLSVRQRFRCFLLPQSRWRRYCFGHLPASSGPTNPLKAMPRRASRQRKSPKRQQ